MAIVIWYPVTQTLYHSFTDWNGARSTWVGWENYQRIVSNGELWLLLRNNLIFVFAVPGILLISSGGDRAALRRGARLAFLPLGLLPADHPLGGGCRHLDADHVHLAGGGERRARPGGLEQLQHDWLGTVPTAFMVLIFAFYWQTLGRGC